MWWNFLLESLVLQGKGKSQEVLTLFERSYRGFFGHVPDFSHSFLHPLCAVIGETLVEVQNALGAIERYRKD